MNRALAVVGPTGSGKTALAMELAVMLGTEIVSADSMQFYRGMEIGCAAPSPEEQERVRHHFVSFLEPHEDMAAGKYERLAREVALDLSRRGLVPILCGGSGLYLNAFMDGLFEGPARDQGIRDRLRALAANEGNGSLYERLRQVDPEYAGQLTSQNDLVRVVRALEVYETTGRPYSEWHAEHRKNARRWQVTQFALRWDRQALYDRINRRVDEMIAAGWVEETRKLLETGHSPDIDRLKALGYREIAAYLRGECTLEDAIEAAKQHHRRYAKKQLTWFNADKRIHWLECGEDTAVSDLAARALELFNQPPPHSET